MSKNVKSEKIDELKGRVIHANQEAWHDSLANLLINYVCLVIGENRYRVVECEFYYNAIDHQDIYVHCEDEQMTARKLYYNKVGGVDLTLETKRILLAEEY